MAPSNSPRLYIDANVFIYALGAESAEGNLARLWLSRVDRGDVPALTSELTLLEVPPHPIAKRDGRLVDGYKRFLRDRDTLRVVPVTLDILYGGADLRALHRSETPDAIHAATAQWGNCPAFLTNDIRIRLPAGTVRRGLSDVG